MEVQRCIIARYEPSDAVRQLLDDFRWMVNYAIRQGLKHGYSVKKLHQLCYRFFAERFGYYALYYPMAYRVAQSIIRSWRANFGKKKPEMVKKVVRVHKALFRIDPDRSMLYLKVRKGEELALKLKLSKWHKEQLRKGRNGEILLNERFAYIPITIRVDLIEPEKWVAVDVNENCIAYATSEGRSGIVETGLREVKTAYSLKRKRIQEKLSEPSRAFDRLMEKYKRRERRRTKDILHKLSRLVADSFRGYGILLEDLKGLRKSVNAKRKRYNELSKKVQKCSTRSKAIKGRLNRFPFRRLQSYIEYKSNLNGSPVRYVDPRGTSKSCARCGGEVNSLKSCPRCGLDRHASACFNMLKMWGGCPRPEGSSVKAMRLPLTSVLAL